MATETIPCHVNWTDSLRKPIPTDLLLCQRSYFCGFTVVRTWSVRLWESVNNEKNPISIFKSVRLWECVGTEFDWEVKTGIEKSVRK